MIEHHLEKLIGFVGVVDAGSIRKYAAAMQLSQPGVSQRVSSLERLIGFPLLKRSQTGIQLTEQGRIVYEFGLKLIKEAQVVETSLQQGQQSLIELNFGTYDSVAIYLMPAVLSALQKRLPHVRLKLQCDLSSQVIKQVADGSLDMGLCIVSSQMKPFVVTTLYDDRYGFFINPSKPSEQQNMISVMNAKDHEGKSIATYLKAFGLDSFHQLGAPSFEVAKAMTLAGLGVGVLPYRVAHAAQQLGLLKQVPMGNNTPLTFGLHSFGFAATRSTMNRAECQILLEVIVAELKKSTFGTAGL